MQQDCKYTSRNSVKRGCGSGVMGEEVEERPALERLGQLFRERALRSLRTLVFLATSAIPVESCASRQHRAAV